MESHNIIRKKILALVEEYYNSKFKDQEFTPGSSPVHYAGRVFDEREMVNLVDASLDFWLTAGRYAEDFEADFSDFMELSDTIIVNSGSSANLIALSTLTSPLLGERKLNEGDEVITAAAGFPTTVGPIIQNKLVPVFVDIDLGAYNVIPEEVEKAVSKKTKAIFIAHTLGNPFDLKAISTIAEKHGLWLIEDNCDALGSRYDGRLTGTFGDLSTVSFYPAHHITMGEGGVVCTNDELLARIARSFRDWGRDCYCGPGENNTCGTRFTQKFGDLPIGYDHKYVYSHIGYNLKVTDMQAAIGVAQLEKLASFIEKRKQNHAFLKRGLVKYEDRFILPEATPRSDPSWFSFIITVREDAGFTRTDIARFLEENHIETRNLFAGNITKQPAYLQAATRTYGKLTNTDFVMNNTFFIGVYPGNDEEKLGYVLEVIDKFMKLHG